MCVACVYVYVCVCACVCVCMCVRFEAVLSVSATNSQLTIIETNQFKHLQHISLRLCPGNETAIRKYLASQLCLLKVSDSPVARVYVYVCVGVGLCERFSSVLQCLFGGCVILCDYGCY